MFQTAIKLAEGFTRPVIVSTLRASGEVTSGVGAFVLLNSDGWILTSFHLLHAFRQAEQDKLEMAGRDKEEAALTSDSRLSLQQKRAKIKKLRRNPNWIERQSYWWGQNGAWMESYSGNPLADLALCKLNGFDMSSVPNFPVFGNQANRVLPGTFLCKFGYPFREVTSSWDKGADGFVLADGTLPLPQFAIEGMHTRVKIIEDQQTGETAEYLETSTPGLRGQSGGPTFDEAGVVWAIQSHTDSLDLGFDARVTRNGRDVTEHQVMNVGMGASIGEIMKLLRARNVSVQT